MRITSAGLVGIGTNNPQTTLELGGTNPTLNIGPTNITSGASISYNTSGNYLSINAVTQGVGYRNIAIANDGGNLGVGVVNAATKLEVGGVGKFWTGVSGGLGTVALGDNATTSYNVGIFRGAANSISTAGNYLNAGGYDGIVFTTGATSLGSQTSRMLITQAGNVGINTGAADSYAKLFVNGVVTNSYGPTSALFSDAVTCSLYITHTSGVTGIISDSTLMFGSGSLGAERMRITSAGVLDIGTGAGAVGQIQFPATQVPSANANTLDDYEEGTFTAGIAFGGASVGVTYDATPTCTYTKIGRQVTVTGRVGLSSKGSSTGDATITGLIFPSANTGNAGYGSSSIIMNSVTFANQYAANIPPNSTSIFLQENSLLGTYSALTDADFSNGSNLLFTATYFV
jgi:hypothetical protein